MQAIEQNPYRIVGVLAGASAKEIEKQNSKLRAYARVKKELKTEFYLPPPDAKLRKALFEISLKQRIKVLDFGIDYEKLVGLTENYVSADIESIVNEASSIAMADESKITMEILENVIRLFKPFPKKELRKYELMKAKMEGDDGESNSHNDRRKIGF